MCFYPKKIAFFQGVDLFSSQFSSCSSLNFITERIWNRGTFCWHLILKKFKNRINSYRVIKKYENTVKNLETSCSNSEFKTLEKCTRFLEFHVKAYKNFLQLYTPRIKQGVLGDLLTFLKQWVSYMWFEYVFQSVI